MIKKALALMFGIVALVSARAGAFFDSGTFYQHTIATEAVLLAPTTYVIDTNFLGESRVSAQTTYSTVTVPTVAFYDGTPATAAVTITSNTALSAATAYITLTVSSNSILAPTTAWITISVASNTSLAGARISFAQGGATWTFTEGVNWTRNSFSTTTSLQDFSTATAVSIATALNFSTYGITASTGSFFTPPYMSTAGPNVVLVRAINAGSYANSWSLTSSTQFALTVAYSTGNNSGATANPAGISTAALSNCGTCSYTLRFYPGNDPAYFILTTTQSYRFTAMKEWLVDIVSSGTAQSIAQAVNFSSYGVIVSTTYNANIAFFLTGNDPSVQITTGPNNVVFRTLTAGRYGNNYSLASSTQFALVVARSSADLDSGSRSARLWPGTSNFIEGRDAVVVKIGSQPFTAGVDFQIGATSSGTAAALSVAIASIFSTSQTVISSFTAAGVVTATMTYVQGIGTYTVYDLVTLFTSSNAAVTLQALARSTFTDGSASGFFTGGVPTQIDTFTFTISTTTGLTFAIGTPVLFSTPSALVPPPHQNLTDGVTYFITNKGPGLKSFQLALTSSGAVAGVPIVISTQAQTATKVGNSFRLRPLPFSQAVNVKWQRSNDGNNWFDVVGTSFTINLATLANSTTYFDFQYETARYLRYTVGASSNSPVTTPTVTNGKR